MNDAIIIRRLRDDDPAAVEALYDACVATEPGIGPVKAEDWSATITLPQFGGGRDFLVAIQGDRLIGLAESALRNQNARSTRYLKLMVHPDHRRRQIATTLLSAVLNQGPSDGSLGLQCHVPASWTAGLGFLARFGFSEIETEIFMRCETMISGPEPPVGIVFRSPEDAACEADVVAAIHNQAFRDDVGLCLASAEDMRQQFRRSRLWTAILAGEIIAYALIEHDENLSWLETLAVAPPHQRRGIGVSLAIAALRGDGVGSGRSAGLSVSSRNASAISLYRRLGFKTRFEKSRYEAFRDHLLVKLRSLTPVSHSPTRDVRDGPWS